MGVQNLQADWVWLSQNETGSKTTFCRKVKRKLKGFLVHAAWKGLEAVNKSTLLYRLIYAVFNESKLYL